jgi:hypothetical protein
MATEVSYNALQESGSALDASRRRVEIHPHGLVLHEPGLYLGRPTHYQVRDDPALLAAEDKPGLLIGADLCIRACDRE